MSTQQTEFLARHLHPQSGIGRVALITGGTRGIGKEAARNLLRAGVSVVLAARGDTAGRRAAAELSEDGRDGARSVFHPLELADPTSIRQLVDHVGREFGRLDVLVNNAALGFPPRSAFEVTADEMRNVFDVNVFAVVTLIQTALPLLEDSDAGRIVNVSSERGALGVGDGPIAAAIRSQAEVAATPGSMAHRIAFVTQPNLAYSASKTALNAVTQHFAYQFERTGSSVRINSAAPGHCATAFNDFSGHRTPQQGARIVSALALAGADAPNGGFYADEGPTTL